MKQSIFILSAIFLFLSLPIEAAILQPANTGNSSRVGNQTAVFTVLVTKGPAPIENQSVAIAAVAPNDAFELARGSTDEHGRVDLKINLSTLPRGRSFNEIKVLTVFPGRNLISSDPFDIALRKNHYSWHFDFDNPKPGRNRR
jgi:hypothetical protein